MSSDRGRRVGGGAGVQQIIALRQQIIDRSQLLQQLHAPQETASRQQRCRQRSGASGFADALKARSTGSAPPGQGRGAHRAYQRGEVTDVAKVMLARQEAGVAFEATLQVRNKLLSAYQDIMRMGV